MAQHVFEKPGGFSVYWAVKDDSPIKNIADLKGKTVGISVIGGGTQGPFNMLLKKNGDRPDRRTSSWSRVGFAVSEDALRQGRVDAVNMNQPFAARAEAKGGTRKLFSLSEAMPNIVHILEACRADFVDKNPDLVKAYVARHHARHEEGARQSRGNAEGRLRTAEGADPGAGNLSAQGQ